MVASRREFIGLGAAAVASGALYQRPAAAAVPAVSAASTPLETGDLALLSLTKVASEYVGLVKTGAGARPELRRLVVEPDGTLRVAEGFGPPLPSDVAPVSLATMADGILVGGSRAIQVDQVPTLAAGLPADGAATVASRAVTGDVDEVIVPVYGQTASLLQVTDSDLVDVELPQGLADLSFSVAESLLPEPGDGTVRALIAHNRQHAEACYAAGLTMLTVVDGSVVAEVDVADELGESGPNLLAPAPAVGSGPQILVNRSDATYERLVADGGAGGVRAVARAQSGRAVAFFGHGCLVEDVTQAHPQTSAFRWDPTTDRPTPQAVEELMAAPEGRPQLLPIGGDHERAAAVVAGGMVLVDM